MDERLMKKCIGRPIPEWDLGHRLWTDQPAGSEIQDFGTIFRINSVFMDVTEPSLLDRQWVLAGVVISCLGVAVGPYIYFLTHANPAPAFWMLVFNCLALVPVILFGSLVWKLGRGLFFGLTFRPIRFHRGERKLYAIRERRRSANPEDGDVVWEVPWSADSIFCLHREDSPFGTVFHIRHYALDNEGNVVRVFSIGREWTGKAQVQMALAQWNYWRKFMNDGPNGLPKPMLFHTQKETLRESFLFSLYGFGMRSSAFVRLLMMPQILFFTALRFIANATCRDPVWPGPIARISAMTPADPYAEPRPGTPVGWGDTVLAQQRGDYPNDPKARVEEWTGDGDATRYAATWLDQPGAGAVRG